MRLARVLPGLLLALTLVSPSDVFAAPSPATPLPPLLAVFGSAKVGVELTASDPDRYLTAYHKALAYLTQSVQADGLVMNSAGNPATVAAASETAIALAMNSQDKNARRVAGWIVDQQNADGGYGAFAGSPSNLADTADALWALEVTTYLATPGNWSSEKTSLVRSVHYLMRLQGSDGAMRANLSSPLAPAVANATAARALLIAATIAGRLGWSEASSWLNAAQHVRRALNIDNRLSRVSTSDFIAAPLFGLSTNISDARRQVAALTTLGFAYPGFGAKVGPGYLSGMDWVQSSATFNLIVAAANVGLDATAVSQYHFSLGLRDPDGGFGVLAHPSVGPETGIYQRGPTPARAGVTAQFLIATDTLLEDHLLGTAGVAVQWQQGGVAMSQMDNQALLDPSLVESSSSPAAAVLVPSLHSDPHGGPITAASAEQELQLNAAYDLTRAGYRVDLFWVKPNQAGVFYPTADLWPNLKKFQLLVLPAATLQRSTGFRPVLNAHLDAINRWIDQGGRLLDLGDTEGLNTSLPWNPSLKRIKPQVGPVAIASSLGHGSFRWLARSPMAWPDPISAYQMPTKHWQVLARAHVQNGWLPVVEGGSFGRGRVLTTTLPTANAIEDQASILEAMVAWLKPRLPAAVPPPAYLTWETRLMKTIATVYSVPSTHQSLLFRETNHPSHRVSYLWPFSQVLAGFESAMVHLPAQTPRLREVFRGLQAYYNSTLKTPAYVPYLAALGGSAPYFDDDGWVGLDQALMHEDTGSHQALSEAETTFRFLTTGWNKQVEPLGGEFFNVAHGVRTQTATGSFLNLALRLYLITANPYYLNWAKTINTWEVSHFQGPNGIYWDNMNNQGKVSGLPLPSDTGIMLQADVLWYHVNQNPKALRRAEDLADAAMTVFVNPLTGQIEDDAVSSGTAFNAMLIEGLSMLYRVDPNPRYRTVITRQAILAHDSDLDADGLYGTNINGLNNPANPIGVLVQGATLNLFAMANALPSPPA